MTGGTNRMSNSGVEKLKAAIRDVPDFPKQGIIFRDITPILSDPLLLNTAIEVLVEPYRNVKVDKIIGIESRGFIFAPPIAMRLGAGFVPIRKMGKLPAETIHHSYDLEYGSATMEMHKDAVSPGERVILIDDLIATGGSAAAAIEMIRKLGGEVIGASFLVELHFLNGRAKLPDIPVHTHIVY